MFITAVLLVIGYTIGWFLFTTVLFIASSGRTPSMQMVMAFVLGLLSTILHGIVYYLTH